MPQPVQIGRNKSEIPETHVDPVCKMLAPYAAYRRTAPTEPWFCSERCAEAYRRSPDIYPAVAKRANSA